MYKISAFTVLLGIAISATAQKATEVDISKTPCYQKPASTEDKYYGFGQAVSSDLSVCRNKANMQAMQELSSSIRTHISAITEIYTRSSSLEARVEFDEVIRSGVNESLEGVTVYCQKQERTSDGKVRFYMMLELNRKLVYERIKESSSKKKFEHLDQSKEKFQEIFDREMANHN
jgi:hypothetical protein